MTAQTMQIGSRPCRIYGEAHAEYLLLQMTGEHELQSMDSEVAAIAQSAHHFLFAAIPVESWNDALSPWEAPAVWGTQGFGGNATDTLRFLTERGIPTLKQQFPLPENVKIILGGYSLAGLFALWASTQTNLFYGIAAASPSVWFPGWMEFEQRHPIQAQRVYLSLGDKEERTKNAVMAAVGDNIRTLHSRLTERGTDCTLEWNSGGHFKDADLRTAKAFRWMMEEQHMTILIDADGCPVVDLTLQIAKRFGVPVIILCDTAHQIEREGAQTLVFDKGADSVDFALVKRVKPGDIVVTQDYGLASMCLAKCARVLNQNGLEYTADNIDALMLRRYENKKLLRAGKHPKGSPKRTKEQDVAFSTHFKAVLEASRRLML